MPITYTPIEISQLQDATTITGNEYVPIVQNNTTVKAPIAQFGQGFTQGFVTFGGTTMLPNARTLTAGPNITITDGGPGSSLTVAATSQSADAAYVLLSADPSVPNARILTANSPLTLTDGGPGGNAALGLNTVPISSGGTGNVTANAAINALLPSQVGNNGKYLTTNGTDTSWATNAGGDVTGPASSTDNAISRFDGITGKLIQDSVVFIGDTGIITGGNWQGTAISAAFGGTGIVNNAASTLTISGAFATMLTVTGITGVTLPTTGTLATIAGTETFTNKTVTDATFTIQDDVDNTKKARFQASGIATGTTRTLTIPDLSSTIAVTANNLSVFAATTSAQLAGIISDETGSGPLVFATSPTLTTAVLGSSTATTQSPADNSTKLATTAYVDNAVLGQRQKEAVKYASTAALPSIVYANGSSGVGATLTGVALAAISLDSSSPSVNDRVLIKNQASTFQNGIYTVTATGSGIAVFVLTRAMDFDQASDIQTGDSLFVTAGSTLANTTWTYNGIDSPVMGTDAITFVQSAGPGSFTGGNGITITGTSIAINTSVTVDKTTVQTLTNKTLTSPTLTSPDLGTPASGVATNLTGTASGLTAGTVTTNANLTGIITSSGNSTSFGTFTSAQILAGCSDETGSGAMVFANTPTLITPIIGAATGTSLSVTSSLTVNATTGNHLPSPLAGTLLQLAGTDATAARIGIYGFAGAPSLNAFRADTTSLAPSAVQNGEAMFQFNAFGYGTSQYSAASLGVVQFVADENFSNTANGTYIAFRTTPIGSVTSAEAGRFNSDGTLNVNTTTKTGAGTVNANTAYYVAATKVVGARVTGWAAATGTKLTTTFDTTTVTTAQLAARVGSLIDNLISHGLIGA